MSKIIHVDFHQRESNQEITDFSEIFWTDLQRCLSRFKTIIAKSDGKVVNPENFNFIFLAMQDLEDPQFVKEILNYADTSNSLLISTGPLRNITLNFPRHKFKIINFWDEIKETGEIRFFRRNASENHAEYWERITDIAIELVEKGSLTKDTKKGKVFIAQTDNTQSSDRDNLVRDLVEMGYDVVPDRSFNLDYNECTDQINSQLSGCKLIIHPIPLVYSKYFPDKQISIVEHQCVLSSKYAAEKQKDVRRIIWIPSDFDITDEENQIFVEKIQRDQDQSNNTVVLKVTLQELKKIYQKILSGEALQIAGFNMPDLYFVADKDDEKMDAGILDANNMQGVAVGRNFKGITYNQHLQYLANSQFVVINYTAENEPWFTMKVNDIFKSKGVVFAKPFKKLILVKESKDLDTSAFDHRFSEVHVGSLKDLNLNLAGLNN